MAVGSVVGGAVRCRTGQDRAAPAGHAGCRASASRCARRVAPSLAVELLALALAGVQHRLHVDRQHHPAARAQTPEMRGRVMAFWFVAFQGSTPIGGPIVGCDERPRPSLRPRRRRPQLPARRRRRPRSGPPDGLADGPGAAPRGDAVARPRGPRRPSGRACRGCGPTRSARAHGRPRRGGAPRRSPHG